MKKTSLTITGLMVVLIGFILDYSGIEIASADIQTTIEVLIQVGGLIVAWFGRVRQGDINVFGMKQ